MTVLNSAIKTVDTDRAIKRYGARMVACSIRNCRDDATFTAFYRDGSLNRTCLTHQSKITDRGVFAVAHHRAILVDETMTIKAGRKAVR